MTLKRCLEQQQHAPGADFELQLARTVADAWLIAINQDLRFPSIRLNGSRPDLRRSL